MSVTRILSRNIIHPHPSHAHHASRHHTSDLCCSATRTPLGSVLPSPIVVDLTTPHLRPSSLITPSHRSWRGRSPARALTTRGALSLGRSTASFKPREPVLRICKSFSAHLCDHRRCLARTEPRAATCATRTAADAETKTAGSTTPRLSLGASSIISSVSTVAT